MKISLNESLKSYLLKAEKILNEKTLRERVILLAAILFLIFFIWKNLIFSYLSQSTDQVLESKEKISSQINQLEGQIDSLSEVIGRDSTASLEAHLKDLTAKNHSLRQEILDKTQNLTEAKDMQGILRSLLQKHPQIKLRSINSVADKPLFEPSAPTQAYQKGIVMEFEGNFLDNLALLRQLEQAEPKIVWDEMVYDVTAYPIGKLRVRLHTIGQEEGWVGV